VLLGALGWAYLWAFVGLRGQADDLAHRVAQGMGVLGLVAFLVALGRSALPPLFHYFGWLQTRPLPYLVPDGLLLMGLGAMYAILSAGISTDNRLIVLTRRELAAFFYSPVAYIVLIGFTALAAIQYFFFLDRVIRAPQMGEPMVEPVIVDFVISWWAVIPMIFIVPVLTMRLLSEERRSGTLEVLLTAPLEEASVVVSKFLAALVFFLVLWLPWGLFLVALRVQGGEAFDYRPLLSFFIALAATGAGCVSMGLFFSSMTRNQIIAAIVTFVGMFAWTLIFFLKRDLPQDSPWRIIMTYVSYVDLWIEAVQGTLSLRHLVLQISVAIFWLFVTVKVLEARRWT
jgi:ABC-2 type transport system permease protein